MAFLEPDRYFSRLSLIDIERDIVAPGYAHVLLDIDNTILTRDTHEVPRDIGLWLARARDRGVSFCLVSNNWHRGVYELAERLELPLVAKAVKPLPPAFLRALHLLGAKRAETLVIGDQLITDVLGAHFLGMKAYLLSPLVEQDLPHTLALRNLERAIMGNRQPEGAAMGDCQFEGMVAKLAHMGCESDELAARSPRSLCDSTAEAHDEASVGKGRGSQQNGYLQGAVAFARDGRVSEEAPQ